MKFLFLILSLSAHAGAFENTSPITAPIIDAEGHHSTFTDFACEDMFTCSETLDTDNYYLDTWALWGATNTYIADPSPWIRIYPRYYWPAPTTI